MLKKYDRLCRILIVDDEFLVRVGVKTSIAWEKAGFTIIGEAANAVEALNKIAVLQPDVVVTDISMPGMNGLELIAEIRKKYPDITCVILTNYEDFKYAQNAIELGVSYYLLKSDLNTDSILPFFEKLRSNLLPKATKTVLAYNKTDLLKKWLLDALYISHADIHAYCINCSDTYNKDEKIRNAFFCDDLYIAIKYSGIPKNDITKNNDMIYGIIASVAEIVFPRSTINIKCFEYFYAITILFPIQEDKFTTSDILKKTTVFEQKINLYFTLKLYGGFSSVNSVSNIYELLKEAESARQQSFFTEKFIFYSPTILPTTQPVLDGIELIRLVVKGDYNSLIEFIHAFFCNLRKAGNYTYLKTAFLGFIDIAQMTAKKLPQFFCNKDEAFILSFLSVKEIEQHIIDTYDEVLKQNGWGSKKSLNSTVQKCMDYVSKNYQSNISEDMVARHLEITQSYLSTIFKKEIGVNFITYITRYRIEKAKDLLIHTNMKIYEIADAVGFYSPYYFSKIFKKLTGKSCKIFKNEYVNNNIKSVEEVVK